MSDDTKGAPARADLDAADDAAIRTARALLRLAIASCEAGESARARNAAQEALAVLSVIAPELGDVGRAR